jgi:hypothetical protein
MDSITIQEQNYKDRFNIVEYAKKNLFSRHIFLTTTEPNNPKLKEELYRSHYIYDNEIVDLCEKNLQTIGKKSIEGFSGLCWLDQVIIDIDDEDLSRALTNTRTFLQTLESNYEIDLASLRINFSGSKGFHIRFPVELFGGFEPSKDLPAKIKEIVLKLTDGIITVDKSVYDKTRLMRVLNSFNIKSGLYAIPLAASEIFTMSIEEIKELAANPRDLQFMYADEYMPVERLVELKGEEIETETVQKRKLSTKEVLSPKEPGERHEALAAIVGKLLAANIGDDDIRTMMMFWNQQNTPPKDDKEFEKEVNELINRYKDIKGDFWRIRKGKFGLKPNINLTQFIDFLNRQGFGKVFFAKSYLFVRIIDNIACQLTNTEIKDFIFSHVQASVLEPVHRNLLMELMYDKVSKYFNEKLIETINSIEMKMKPDTKEKSFLFYKNGILSVKRNEGIELKDYSTLDKPIWDTQIKDRNFTPVNVKTHQAEFERFLWNVVKGDQDRMLSLCSAIGYLLSKHKNKSVTKAIILSDERVTESAVGRTGKSLFGKALSYMRDSVRIDGKNFIFREAFTFQQVGPKTELLEFNDVKRDFDFERLFSVLTDDMTIEYKREQPYPIPFEQSPKIFVSTNYTIKGEGDSFRDRMFEIEFSDYYNSQNKPIDEFGHMFFDDWDEEEWNRFDNFMVECLQLYIDEGLVEYKRINLDEKKLLFETSAEFLEFMKVGFVVSTRFDKEVLYTRFKNFIGYDNDIFGKCPIKKNTFTKYLKSYANYKNLGYTETNSNSLQYVQLG